MTTLYDPAQIGDLVLKNRVVMAPMTRNRASGSGVHTPLAVDYYSQRASAGLLITEASQVDAWGGGLNTPGCYSAEQIEAWRSVTDAVHAEGGKIFLQIWHVGRITTNVMTPDGSAPRGVSAVQAKYETVTKNGREACSMPREMTEGEIWETIENHVTAAQNAKDAGFDGIELHAANGYLVDQFLQDGTNQRTDAWGGTAEKRCRFMVEVLERVTKIWDPKRIAVRFSPNGDFNDMSDSDTLGTFRTAVSKLNDLGIGILHMVEQFPFSDPVSENERAILEQLKSDWNGFYIANGGFGKATGETYVSSGGADAIAYGRPFIANPDLPERLKSGAPLNEVDQATIYGGDHRGYTDYPAMSLVEATSN